jgi:creatinine amidohydrolase
MLWHELKWPQIEAMDKQLPVVVPLGSLEQHGRHLPLFVDSIQVTEIAQRVERAMPAEILLLPTLWLGCSDHHLDFPGTITVKPSLYSEMIKQVVRSILHAGFTKIFLFNGHGGNETPATQALSELVAESDQADAANIVFSSWWQLGRESLKAEKHGMSTPGITHACEYETSMMLALRADLVKQDAAIESPRVIDSPFLSGDAGPRVRLFHRFHRLTPSGSMGKPTAATAEHGRSLLDAVVGDVVAFLEDFATWPLLPPLHERK